jgi:Domain of unknown function (DUF3943)
MRLLGRAALAVAIAAVLARPVRAQETPQWELGAFGGAFFGSRVSLTPSAATLISSGATFGLRGAFVTSSHFRLQASFSSANVRVVSENPLTGARLAPDEPGHVRTYELDWLYGFGRGRLQGFAGLGAGVMTLPQLPAGQPTGGDTRFTANVTVGGEYFLNERLALVLEGKYRWRDTGQRLGTIVCESGECRPFGTNLFSSSELSGGFTYRFGDVRPFPSDSIGDLEDTEDTVHRYPGTAAGELFLAELLPWAVNRYISEADYAYVTADSIKAGFRTGFTYDLDSISTNVFNHPIHGSMYFSAARSNGYGFWESGAVTLLGSFLWECCAESEPPAINDLVNTALGGMVIGEATYRLSSMLWAGSGGEGGPSFAERLGAIVLSPVGALSRALHGEDAQLPRAESVPSRFHLDLDAGYLHVGGGAEDPDRGGVAVRAEYGDPFAGEMRKPFDSFALGVELNAPVDTVLVRAELQGILKGWDLSDANAASRYIFGLFMGYEYINNDAEAFGTESVSAGLLSRWRLGRDFVAEGALLANVYPLAAIKTVDGLDPESEVRDYDFGSGGGLSIAARLKKADCEIATLSYGVAWAGTANGASTANTLQFFRAAARLPIADGFGAGASYSLYRRQTSYASLPSQTRTQAEWGAFLSRHF